MTDFRHRVFDVEIERKVEVSNLEWPESDRFGSDSGLGGNRHYEDLRRQPWWVYRESFAYEQAFVRQFEAAGDDDARADLMAALDEDEDAACLCGLDPGVASCVLAISASRCAPFTSCNGGAFDGGHLESYPLVAFYARPPLVASLLSCAEEAGVGLFDYGGALQIYARQITGMLDFGATLYGRRRELAAVRLIPPRPAAPPAPETRQLSLFGD